MMGHSTLSAATRARIERLRAQAAALSAVPEPNLFHRRTVNAMSDLDQATKILKEGGALNAFLDVIEDELMAAQRAHDRATRPSRVAASF